MFADEAINNTTMFIKTYYNTFGVGTSHFYYHIKMIAQMSYIGAKSDDMTQINPFLKNV